MERLTIDEVIEHCDRQVKLFSRFFDMTDDEILNSNPGKTFIEHKLTAEWLRELKAYRDAEEQGLLVKLPCKCQEVVWTAEKGFKTHKAFYASPSAMLDDIEHGFGIGYTMEEAEAALTEMEK